jgi:hypothetical protein
VLFREASEALVSAHQRKIVSLEADMAAVEFHQQRRVVAYATTDKMSQVNQRSPPPYPCTRLHGYDENVHTKSPGMLWWGNSPTKDLKFRLILVPFPSLPQNVFLVVRISYLEIGTGEEDADPNLNLNPITNPTAGTSC